jgi:hypothetical protein
MFGKGGMNLGNLKKMAEDMQSKMAKMQDDLKERVVEGSAGGGAVTAFVNGAQEVMGIKINPDVVKPEDAEMLSDMITAAVNQGLQKSKEMSQNEMSKITGGLGGMPGLPF